MNLADKHYPKLIQSMLDPVSYIDAVHNCRLVETHISWVILTDSFVYKIKKPVNFGFLDFSSLEKRKYYCYEELRLNRRLAPDIYLAVVSITGTVENPIVGGDGEAIEYAVKMLPFQQQFQLDRLLEKNELQPQVIDAFAQTIAEFHHDAAIANESASFGNPAEVRRPVEENYFQIRQCIHDVHSLKLLDNLEIWEKKQFDKLESLFLLRKKQGFIRECHGDLHLRNLALYNNKPLVFDCIEFNENLRWIDVMSDVAFLVMDLQDREQIEFAQRFLNRYLECSGDYAGIGVLPFYLVYRAMVRAKVAGLRLGQDGITAEETKAAQSELNMYLELAQTYTMRSSPKLIITYGMSASGKSSVSKVLLEKLNAVRIRSDLERKRIYGLLQRTTTSACGVSADASMADKMYTSEATMTTYRYLAELTGKIVNAGFSVIVDATFLDKKYRDDFENLAKVRKIPYIILQFFASLDTLRQRILNRKEDISDADMSVLENQIINFKPLSSAEERFVIPINTEKEIDFERIVSRINNQT